MMTITQNVNSLLVELNSISSIKVNNHLLEMWVSNIEDIPALTEIVKKDGLVFPTTIDDVVLIPNGCDLQWSLNQGNIKIAGRFELSNIYDSVTLDTYPLDMFDDVLDEREVSDETKELFRKSRIIDYIESFGYTVILKEDDGSYDLNSLLFMDEDELEFHKLNLDLETYYRTLLTIKGAYRWQYLFFSNDEGEGYYDSYSFETICRWIHVLPELFPNHDYSLVIKKFKEMVARDGEDEFGWANKSIEKLNELGIWKF